MSPLTHLFINLRMYGTAGAHNSTCSPNRPNIVQLFAVDASLFSGDLYIVLRPTDRTLGLRTIVIAGLFHLAPGT